MKYTCQYDSRCGGCDMLAFDYLAFKWVVHLLVQVLPLYGKYILRPLLFYMYQRPLPLAEGDVLDA